MYARAVASALIRIDQPLNTVPNGVAGYTRDDILLGRPVIVKNGNANGVRTRRWILETPFGSAVSLSTTDGEAPTFTPDVVGTYRVLLSVNAGGEGETDVRDVIVRDPAGHRFPATKEAAEANYQIAPGVFNKEGWKPDLQRLLMSYDNRGQAAIEVTVAGGDAENILVTLPDNMDEGVLQYLRIYAAGNTDSSLGISTPTAQVLTWPNFDPSDGTGAKWLTNVSIINDDAGLVAHQFTIRVVNNEAFSSDYEIWLRVKAT